MSINKVFLIGRVGQIEVKNFEGGNGPRKCATFSLATSERYKDRNGNLVENTEWHNIVSWNHAELCEKYVSKGSSLFIEGKLRTRTWDDQSGNKRYATEIFADSVQMLGKKEDSSRPAQHQETRPKYNTTPISAGEDNGDDLPF